MAKQTVKCKCGTKYKVSAKLAGKKAKCKKCGLQFVIPVPGKLPTSSDPIAPMAVAATLLNPYSSVTATPIGPTSTVNSPTQPIAAGQPAGTVRPCPECNRTLGKGKVVCIYCGYHTGRNQQLKPAGNLSAAGESKHAITNCPECNRALGKGKSTCMYCGYNVDSGKKISMKPVGYGDGRNYGVSCNTFGNCSSCNGGCGGCGSSCGGCGGCGG